MSETAQHESDFSLPTPVHEHALLKPFEGTFDSEVRMWMGPGEPHISTGTMKNEFVLGGLFLRQDYTGDAIDGSFPSFQGQGYWGYNTTSQLFEGFWIDIASTTMQLEKGTVDSSGKVWEMHSVVQNPQSGAELTKRSVITLIDDDHNKLESFFADGDQPEFKNMEINFKRK